MQKPSTQAPHGYIFAVTSSTPKLNDCGYRPMSYLQPLANAVLPFLFDISWTRNHSVHVIFTLMIIHILCKRDLITFNMVKCDT